MLKIKKSNQEIVKFESKMELTVSSVVPFSIHFKRFLQNYQNLLSNQSESAMNVKKSLKDVELDKLTESDMLKLDDKQLESIIGLKKILTLSDNDKLDLATDLLILLGYKEEENIDLSIHDMFAVLNLIINEPMNQIPR
jgi:hypothetical protein